MPTCLLICEGCGTRQPSVVDADAVIQLQAGKTLPKHCLVCHTTTDWAMAFLEKRSGMDRRKTDPEAGLDGSDRRTGRERRGDGTTGGPAGQ
jgi:hypothetical protein